MQLVQNSPFPNAIVPIIFDVDGTKIHPEVNNHISNQIAVTLKKQFSFTTLEEARAFGDQFYFAHGNTLYGLLKDGHLTTEQARQFLADMHAIHPKAYKRVCRDSHLLNKPLQALAKMTELYIFTNGTTAHAYKALQESKINSKLFTAIVGIDQIPDFIPKPFAEAYQWFIQASGLKDLKDGLFFEDSPKNLITGHQFGMNGVWVDGPVHPNTIITSHPDAHIFARSPCLLTYLKGLVKHWSSAGFATIGVVIVAAVLAWRQSGKDTQQHM